MNVILQHLQNKSMPEEQVGREEDGDGTTGGQDGTDYEGDETDDENDGTDDEDDEENNNECSDVILAVIRDEEELGRPMTKTTRSGRNITKRSEIDFSFFRTDIEQTDKFNCSVPAIADLCLKL